VFTTTVRRGAAAYRGVGRVLSDNGTWIVPASGSGGGLTDGDKGDIVVSGTGTVLMFDMRSSPRQPRRCSMTPPPRRC
jgi:Holliday junction resolvase